MKAIISKDCPVYFNHDGYLHLFIFLRDYNPSQIIVLVDKNTKFHCLPVFEEKVDNQFKFTVLEMATGEENKTIEGCIPVWEMLSDIGADRKSLIVNLGGGVVTDMGGFIASTYKRGIEYINVPTSLLAMVDASIGGKTGVDLGSIKNQIGVINSGKMVLIDTSYLKTLPDNQFCSGAAEMLKHGLVFDTKYWEAIKTFERRDSTRTEELIHRSIEIKNEIVEQDPTEKHLRKSLNFGHTLGHAIESYFLEQTNIKTLLHGEAIAIGMILETFISTKLLNFPKSELEEVTETFRANYPSIPIQPKAQDAIINLMKFDKKNEGGRINFVLLEQIGKPKIDCQVENQLIKEAFHYYNKSLEVS